MNVCDIWMNFMVSFIVMDENYHDHAFNKGSCIECVGLNLGACVHVCSFHSSSDDSVQRFIVWTS